MTCQGPSKGGCAFTLVPFALKRRQAQTGANPTWVFTYYQNIFNSYSARPRIFASFKFKQIGGVYEKAFQPNHDLSFTSVFNPRFGHPRMHWMQVQANLWRLGMRLRTLQGKQIRAIMKKLALKIVIGLFAASAVYSAYAASCKNCICKKRGDVWECICQGEGSCTA